MKSLLILLMTLMAMVCFGQTENEVSKTVSENFVKHYNSGDYKSIFEMYTEDTKLAIPLDKTIEFLTNLKAHAGNILERKFLKYESGMVAMYKTTFERAVFLLKISSDIKTKKINGLMVLPNNESKNPKIDRNITKLRLPFNGEWTVYWGGDTKELNYHVIDKAQKNAFDIMIKNKEGKSFKNDGKTNEDYYAFGKELIAPCKGEVVLVVDGVKDNRPGIMNPVYVPGNTVIIKTENNEYLFFAHFKQYSIKVKQGQMVEQGELLGLCGNSGNSSEPHLHFHIQNDEELSVATGVKCYFENIVVNGESKNDYSPIKSEKVMNK